MRKLIVGAEQHQVVAMDDLALWDEPSSFARSRVDRPTSEGSSSES